MNKVYLAKYLLSLMVLVFLFMPFFAIGGPASKACNDTKGMHWLGDPEKDTGECVVTGLNLEYPAFGGFKLGLGTSLSQLIAWIYYAIVNISAFTAFVMMIVGGVRYLTSAGNPAAMADGRSRIFSAVLGLLVVLSSFLILQTINPDFVLLAEPTL